MRIDHIGIAVRSLAANLKAYEAIGLRATETEAIPTEGVRVAFLPVGESRFELLEPLGADTVIGKFLDKRGEGLHHVAIAVDDILAAMDRARTAGLVVIDQTPRLGARGRRVAFLHPRSTGSVLFELVQNP